MTRLLQVGLSTAAELHSRYGHVACTLGGVNYESRGSRGCLRGSSARGASHPLFRHTFHIVLTDAAAAAAKAYADGCVGQPYVLGQVPSKTRGGDCSGFVSGIICVAKGKPVRRLFSTGTWLARFDDGDLNFHIGLGGGRLQPPGISEIGRPDRPFPGRVFEFGSPKSDHVRWIQSRLNFAGHNAHSVLGGARLVEDGEFGKKTRKVVIFFQQRNGLDDDGEVGRRTWGKLLKVA